VFLLAILFFPFFTVLVARSNRMVFVEIVVQTGPQQDGAEVFEPVQRAELEFCKDIKFAGQLLRMAQVQPFSTPKGLTKSS
jgi:hypothetical protein